MDDISGEDNTICTIRQPCKSIRTAVHVLHMSSHAERGTIHLYGKHSLNHSISIEKVLVIHGYKEATISSPIKSAPMFWLEKGLFLISLNFDNVNLVRISRSKENKTIEIHMCHFNTSTLKIERQNMPNWTHLSISSSNFTGGDGFIIFESTVRITDSRFKSNSAIHASGSGGALYMENSNVTITKSKFEYNSATGSGGAIFMKKCYVTIANSVIKSNTVGKKGGGIHLTRCSCTINNSEIKRNRASSGGGIYLTDSSRITINNSTLMSNVASSGGGGMWAFSSSTATITNSIISSNTAGRGKVAGGGLHFAIRSTTIIINSTIMNNGASKGGGIYASSTGMSITK